MPMNYKKDLHKKIDVDLEKEITKTCWRLYSAPAMLVSKMNAENCD